MEEFSKKNVEAEELGKQFNTENVNMTAMNVNLSKLSTEIEALMAEIKVMV